MQPTTSAQNILNDELEESFVFMLYMVENRKVRRATKIANQKARKSASEREWNEEKYFLDAFVSYVWAPLHGTCITYILKS